MVYAVTSQKLLTLTTGVKETNNYYKENRT